MTPSFSVRIEFTGLSSVYADIPTMRAAAANYLVRTQPSSTSASTHSACQQRHHSFTRCWRDCVRCPQHKGCTGLYMHSMRWPLAAPETDFLHELRAGKQPAHRKARFLRVKTLPCLCVFAGAVQLMAGDKRYVLPRRHPAAAALGYDVSLPFEFHHADPDVVRNVQLYLSDDPEKSEKPRPLFTIIFLQPLRCNPFSGGHSMPCSFAFITQRYSPSN